MCQHCKKSYVKETSYKAHEQKCGESHAAERALLLKAYPLYEKWFSKTKRTPPNFATFATSKFGTHFTSFIEWCRAMKVESPAGYAAVMIEHDIHPKAWSTPDAFRLYMAEFDDVATIEQWLQITVANVRSVCERANLARLSLDQFYTLITPFELVHMIRTKMIYPRFLVCDPNFNRYLEKLPVPLQAVIADAIDPRYLVGPGECDDTITAVINNIGSL